MGIDWQTKCAKTWQRSWDRGRVELSEPTLFTSGTPDVESTFRAKPLGHYEFQVGAEYQIRAENDSIVVIDGVSRVGIDIKPPERILRAIRESGCGVAIGIVREVYEYTRSAEIGVR